MHRKTIRALTFIAYFFGVAIMIFYLVSNIQNSIQHREMLLIRGQYIGSLYPLVIDFALAFIWAVGAVPMMIVTGLVLWSNNILRQKCAALKCVLISIPAFLCMSMAVIFVIDVWRFGILRF